LHLFYQPDISTGILPPEESHHAVKVLRLTPGSLITLADGDSTYRIEAKHLLLSNRISNNEQVTVPANLLPNNLEDISEETYQLSLNWIEKNYFKRCLDLVKGDNQKLIQLLKIGKTRYYEKKKDLGLVEQSPFERSI
jgi:DNA-binding NtrC family response regulator